MPTEVTFEELKRIGTIACTGSSVPTHPSHSLATLNFLASQKKATAILLTFGLYARQMQPQSQAAYIEQNAHERESAIMGAARFDIPPLVMRWRDFANAAGLPVLLATVNYNQLLSYPSDVLCNKKKGPYFATLAQYTWLEEAWDRAIRPVTQTNAEVLTIDTVLKELVDTFATNGNSRSKLCRYALKFFFANLSHEIAVLSPDVFEAMRMSDDEIFVLLATYVQSELDNLNDRRFSVKFLDADGAATTLTSEVQKLEFSIPRRNKKNGTVQDGDPLEFTLSRSAVLRLFRLWIDVYQYRVEESWVALLMIVYLGPIAYEFNPRGNSQKYFREWVKAMFETVNSMNLDDVFAANEELLDSEKRAQLQHIQEKLNGIDMGLIDSDYIVDTYIRNRADSHDSAVSTPSSTATTVTLDSAPERSLSSTSSLVAAETVEANATSESASKKVGSRTSSGASTATTISGLDPLEVAVDGVADSPSSGAVSPLTSDNLAAHQGRIRERALDMVKDLLAGGADPVAVGGVIFGISEYMEKRRKSDPELEPTEDYSSDELSPLSKKLRAKRSVGGSGMFVVPDGSDGSEKPRSTVVNFNLNASGSGD